MKEKILSMMDNLKRELNPRVPIFLKSIVEAKYRAVYSDILNMTDEQIKEYIDKFKKIIEDIENVNDKTM